MSHHLEQEVSPRVEEDEFFEANDGLNHVDPIGNSDTETVDDDTFVEASSEPEILEENRKDSSDEDENELLEQLVLSDEAIEKLKSESNELKLEGNQAFKEERFEDAIDFYTKALKSCPKTCSSERSVLYSNRATARAKLLTSGSFANSDDCDGNDDEKKKDGEKEEMDVKKGGKRNVVKEIREKAVKDCSKSIGLNDKYLKPLVRRATLLHEMGGEHLDSSLSDYKRILELDPSNVGAKSAIFQLESEINERNEKLKEEMVGKLKELGNFVLKPFGLSTDNFKLDQNPETGGYSINFKQ